MKRHEIEINKIYFNGGIIMFKLFRGFMSFNFNKSSFISSSCNPSLINPFHNTNPTFYFILLKSLNHFVNTFPIFSYYHIKTSKVLIYMCLMWLWMNLGIIELINMNKKQCEMSVFVSKFDWILRIEKNWKYIKAFRFSLLKWLIVEIILLFNSFLII